MEYATAKLVSEKHKREGKCHSILKLDDYSTVCGKVGHVWAGKENPHEANITTTLVHNGKVHVKNVDVRWWDE